MPFRYPFGHLLNFLNTADKDFANGKSADYYRVFDYLRVPSRFVGTETVLNPKVFSASNTAFSGFLPPFNTVSNYRDPGLVNINTMTSRPVWDAIQNGFPFPTFEKLIDSRRGSTGPQPATFNPRVATLPTWFANPFRSAASADLVPIKEMLRPGVNATFLRPDPTSTEITSSGKLPLFGSATQLNWNPTSTQQSYNDSTRNPYFSYQGAQRISNLVTTRSNVFAVWLTIGYFEVLPWPQPGINPTPAGGFTAADYAAHADGYQLGAELGSDTGEVVRHRAFYIFDRSIPVGYERGQNHNVNRAILLRRYIE